MDTIENGLVRCPQCLGPMVLAKASSHGKEYLYCRTCKKELDEMDSPTKVMDQVPSNDDWLDAIRYALAPLKDGKFFVGADGSSEE